jgi:hypothetical protein
VSAAIRRAPQQADQTDQTETDQTETDQTETEQTDFVKETIS